MTDNLDVRAALAVRDLIDHEYYDKESGVLTLIDDYVKVSVTSDRAPKSAPTFLLRSSITYEIKNAMDHLGRAMHRTSEADVAGQLKMARWHFDQARIAALIDIIADLNYELTEIEEFIFAFERKSLDSGALSECHLLSEEYDAVLEDTVSVMTSLRRLEENHGVPSDEEMDRTRFLMNRLLIVGRKYHKLIENIQSGYSIPNLNVLRDYMKSWVLKKISGSIFVISVVLMLTVMLSIASHARIGFWIFGLGAVAALGVYVIGRAWLRRTVRCVHRSVIG